MADAVDVRFDEPLSVYHADREYLGSTQVRLADKSATLFHEQVVLGQATQGQSDALALGSLWHTLRELGIDQFGERAQIVPAEFVTAGGALSSGKAAKEYLSSLPAGTIVLTPDQSDSLGKMQAGFEANSAAMELEESILHREASIRWQSTAGVKLRCRPDAICEGGKLLDYKSSRCGNILREFQWSIRDYGYGLSAALYEQGCLVAGLAEPPMHFIVTSTTTFETQVVTLSPAYMDWARKRLDELLLEIAERRASDSWIPNGYGSVHVIEMPGFGGDRSSFQVQ